MYLPGRLSVVKTVRTAFWCCFHPTALALIVVYQIVFPRLCRITCGIPSGSSSELSYNVPPKTTLPQPASGSPVPASCAFCFVLTSRAKGALQRTLNLKP